MFLSCFVSMTEYQIKLYLSHVPNTTGIDRPYSEILTYKPLTNHVVLRKIPPKKLRNKSNNMYYELCFLFLFSLQSSSRQQIGFQHSSANQIKDQLRRGRQVLPAV
jgi:hypothetical protein